MHPRILWIVLGALLVSAAQAAVVYKWIDADGVVHFSDQAEPGAERITTSTVAHTGTLGAKTASTAVVPAKKAPGSLSFTQFTITSPAADQTFFGDDVVGVHLELMPALTADQVVTWHLNGRQLTDQAPDATSFTLPHLDRGAYAIAATVTDQKSGESQSTESVSFFVRQPSSLAPQSKAP
jgi:hypothetical protein